MNPELRSALAACKTLPTLPTVAAQIIELASQDDYGLADIIDIVRNDIAIAAKLIASANTPHYWRGEAVVDVAQAVSRLGFKATMMIALSFSLSLKAQENEESGVDTSALWHRSVTSASIARLLARQLGSKDAEGCFLAALVQDIGVLALAQAAPQTYADLPNSSHEQLRIAEMRSVDCDHAEVGAWLLNEWKLPGQVVELVASSHDFAALTLQDNANPEQWCVAASGLLADAMLAGDQFQAARMVWLINGRRAEKSEEPLIVPLIAQAVREAESLFDAQLVQDPVALLEASKEKLFEVITDASKDDSDQKIVQLEQRVSMLERQGQLDSLTGAANRGHFHGELDRLFGAATQSGDPLSLIFVDADHFKVINDSYGHLAGDEVLKWLAKALQTLSRDADLVGRYGGEEFVVILPGVSEADAIVFGQRICDHVRNSNIEVSADLSIRVTVSVGVASSEASRLLRSTRDFIFAADQAMYFAKESGRDLCIGASALPSPPADLAALG